jgi:glycosyltransferase involved in cell wall biosynthesis
MATYNNEAYLATAIESVLSQTFTDWELIIVDDCSTDRSSHKVLQYKDRRIRHMQHTRNMGVGATKNTAASLSTGRILAVLDGDDALHKDALLNVKEMYDADPSVGMVYTQFALCDENMIRLHRGGCRTIQKGTYLELCTHDFSNSNVSHLKTFRREAYHRTAGYANDLQAAVDKDIVLKLEEVTTLMYIDAELYLYRSHAHGVTGRRQPDAHTILNRARLRRRLPPT